jgi:hypothetical protein
VTPLPVSVARPAGWAGPPVTPGKGTSVWVGVSCSGAESDEFPGYGAVERQGAVEGSRGSHA